MDIKSIFDWLTTDCRDGDALEVVKEKEKIFLFNGRSKTLFLVTPDKKEKEKEKEEEKIKEMYRDVLNNLNIFDISPSEMREIKEALKMHTHPIERHPHSLRDEPTPEDKR